MNEVIKPDIEVLFEFNGNRHSYVKDGYRPDHLIKDGFVMTGVHHYYDNDIVEPDGTSKGTITFLVPELYPCRLSIGDKINIQEGLRIVGSAIILKVFNPILKKDI